MMDMFDFIALVSASIVTWYAGSFIHSFPAFENRFVAAILTRTVTFPHTNVSNFRRDPMLFIRGKVGTSEAINCKLIVDLIEKDPNFFMADVTSDMQKVLNALFFAKEDFSLCWKDAIMINNGVEQLLTVRYPETRSNRCICLDLVNFRSEYWKLNALLAGSLFLVLVLVVENQTICNSLVEAFDRYSSH